MEAKTAADELPEPISAIAKTLQSALNDLRNRTRIVSAVLARSDGVMITHSLPTKGNVRAIAAMGATIVGTASMTVAEMAEGALSGVLIESDRGKVYARFAHDETLLIVLMDPSSNIGLVLMEVERTIKRLEQIMTGGQQ